MATRYLYLVRHACYNPDEVANPSGTLNREGKRQARLTAKALKDVPVTAVHASTISRAQQTAQYLASVRPEIELQSSHLLWECVPPLYPTDREHFFKHLSDELLSSEHQRAARAFDQFARATRGGDKHEILFTHGNLIRYFVCRTMGVDERAWLSMMSWNCGITRIAIDNSGYHVLISYNDTGHLPPELRTDNV